MFGIFRNPAQARRAAQKFPEDQVFLCTTLSRRAYSRALWGAGRAVQVCSRHCVEGTNQSDRRKFKIFTGSASPDSRERICAYLHVELGRAKLGRFSDGEIYFQILENVRGRTFSWCSRAAIR